VSGIALVAGLSLVVLHRIDGGEVVLSPSHITSMHSKVLDPQKKMMTGAVQCVIWLDDGKLLSVLEPCETVKQLMDEAAK